MHYSVAPEDTYWKDVTWSSSNERVVTVDENGVLKGLAVGKATITAQSIQPSSKVKAQIQVTVNQAVKSIRLGTTNITLIANKNTTIKASINPENATNKKIQWRSENESIATVNAKGQIKGVDTGTTSIIAQAMDGSGVEAKVTVKVIRPVLRVSIDGRTYDYGKAVNVKARIVNSDGSTDGLAKLFPSARIQATLQTTNGRKVPGFIVQERAGLETEFNFPLSDDRMSIGDYKIRVQTDVEKLMEDSPVFFYTADRSWLPPLNECHVELTLNTEKMYLNEDFIMTAKVTDKDGNPVPGVKVGFQVRTMARGFAPFWGNYDYIWNVTKVDGKCALITNKNEKEAKRIKAGKYIVQAFIVDSAGTDEKIFDFTGINK